MIYSRVVAVRTEKNGQRDNWMVRILSLSVLQMAEVIFSLWFGSLIIRLGIDPVLNRRVIIITLVLTYCHHF